MKVLRAITATCVALIATALPAFETECVPGSLPTALREHRNISTLVLSGSAGASDLFFIADSLPTLTDLDISGISIAAYHGKRLKGNTVYPEDAIPAGTFGGTKLQRVILPPGISVGDMAFASTALRSILVPARTRIGEGAFADCRTLTEAKIQGDISSARHAFRNCTALVNTDIGATTTIPDGAFAGCTSLSEINNTESLRSIGKEAFYGTASLKNFVFAPGLAYIGDRAFASSGLTEISLPESLANIGNGAFFDCKNLVKVILPSSALSLSDYLFTNSPIADMPIPENLQSIGRYAMKGSSLVAVLLPSSFGSIGDGAMEDSKCLRAIDVNALASVPATGADVWAATNVADVKLYVGANKADFESVPQWQDFDITEGTSGVETPANGHHIKARFTDNILTLSSDGPDISEVLIAKASGEPVINTKPNAPVCVADLRNLRKSTTIIISATLADGSRSILKFAL